MCYGGTSLAMDHRASCHGSFRISLLGVARTFDGGKGDRRRDCSNNCSQAEAKSFKGDGFNCMPRPREEERKSHLFLGIISPLLEKIAFSSFNNSTERRKSFVTCHYILYYFILL